MGLGFRVMVAQIVDGVTCLSLYEESGSTLH